MWLLAHLKHPRGSHYVSSRQWYLGEALGMVCSFGSIWHLVHCYLHNNHTLTIIATIKILNNTTHFKKILSLCNLPV